MSNSEAAHLYSSNEPKLTNLWPIALPLSGAMLSQALVSLVDTALVGHLGGLALASVSIGSYLVFILVAIVTGFGTGWHSLLSRQTHSQDGLMVLGLVYGVLICVGLAITGAYCIHGVIDFFVVDDRLNSLAAHYAQARLWGLPALVISIGARIYWSERGSPWQYTKIILLVHFTNALISYGLVFGVAGLPALGAVGAGIGTSIALWLGVLLQLILLLRQSQRPKFATAYFIHKQSLLLLKATWAPMLQQLVFALHLAVFLWILSQLGASAMAASFAVLNMGLVMILPAIGLGQAALTLVGTAMTKQNILQTQRWSQLILQTGLMAAIIISLSAAAMSPWLTQWLLVNRELQQLASAALPWYGMAMVLETGIIILSRMVVLTGSRVTVLILVSASQWLVFLPLLAWLAPSYGFMLVWWLHIGYRALSVLLLWLIWRQYIKSLLIGLKPSLNKA